MTRDDILIYTDGSCPNNGKENQTGGYAAIMCLAKDITKGKKISGKVENATNNKAELTAVYQALKTLKKPCNIILRTDSSYICNNAASVKTWRSNGWKLRNGKPVQNQEIWNSIFEEALKGNHRISFEKVQGHSNDKYNNWCDEAAKKACI